MDSLMCCRNVSSAGVDARNNLRQCTGLLDSLLYVLKSVIGKAEMGEKELCTYCVYSIYHWVSIVQINFGVVLPLRHGNVPLQSNNYRFHFASSIVK